MGDISSNPLMRIVAKFADVAVDTIIKFMLIRPRNQVREEFGIKAGPGFLRSGKFPTPMLVSTGMSIRQLQFIRNYTATTLKRELCFRI